MKINKQDFTHYAYFYGVPCYWNANTNTLRGRNRFFNLFVMPLVYFHQTLEILALPFFQMIGFESPGFPIKLKPIDFPNEKES